MALATFFVGWFEEGDKYGLGFLQFHILSDIFNTCYIFSRRVTITSLKYIKIHDEIMKRAIENLISKFLFIFSAFLWFKISLWFSERILSFYDENDNASYGSSYAT